MTSRYHLRVCNVCHSGVPPLTRDRIGLWGGAGLRITTGFIAPPISPVPFGRTHPQRASRVPDRIDLRKPSMTQNRFTIVQHENRAKTHNPGRVLHAALPLTGIWTRISYTNRQTSLLLLCRMKSFQHYLAAGSTASPRIDRRAFPAMVFVSGKDLT